MKYTLDNTIIFTKLIEDFKGAHQILICGFGPQGGYHLPPLQAKLLQKQVAD